MSKHLAQVTHNKHTVPLVVVVVRWSSTMVNIPAVRLGHQLLPSSFFSSSMRPRVRPSTATLCAWPRTTHHHWGVAPQTYLMEYVVYSVQHNHQRPPPPPDRPPSGRHLHTQAGCLHTSQRHPTTELAILVPVSCLLCQIAGRGSKTAPRRCQEK